MEISFDPVSICFQLIRFEVIGERLVIPAFIFGLLAFPTNPI